MEGTQDILKALSQQKGDKVFIGFCLADQDLEATALKKLKDKNLDYIVANGPENIGRATRTFQVYSKAKSSPLVSLEQASVFKSSYHLLKLIASC